MPRFMVFNAQSDVFGYQILALVAIIIVILVIFAWLVVRED